MRLRRPGFKPSAPFGRTGRFEGTATSTGVWLYLMGQRVQAGTAIAMASTLFTTIPTRPTFRCCREEFTFVPQFWQEVTGGGSL